MLFDLISKGKIDTSPYTLQKEPLDQAIQKLDDIASGKLEVARVYLFRGVFLCRVLFVSLMSDIVIWMRNRSAGFSLKSGMMSYLQDQWRRDIV